MEKCERSSPQVPSVCYGHSTPLTVNKTMLRVPPSHSSLLVLAVALFASTGCEGRLGLDLKGNLDTAHQDSGVGPGNPNDTGGNGGGTGGPNDTGESGGGSTSAAVNRNIDFEAENWRDVMWRTRKARRRAP